MLVGASPPQAREAINANVFEKQWEIIVMSTESTIGTGSKTQFRVGWALSGLAIVFMLFDAVPKLLLESHVVEGND